NSVPRFHLTWGCGKALVDSVWGAIERHPRRAQLEVRFRTRVIELVTDGEAVSGCRIVSEDAPESPASDIEASVVVIAAVGVGGHLEIVRRDWLPERGPPPTEI